MTEEDFKAAEASNEAAQGGEEEDEEDDYMNMIISEPVKPREKETYTQRRQRIQRESEARSRTKSKAEIAAEEHAAREDALSKSMLEAPEDARLEGMVGAAMRVAERMHGEREEEEVENAIDNVSEESGDTKDELKRKISTTPLKQINILWRGLVRKREEKERDRRMRYDLQQSLSRLPTYDDADEDKDDKRALGKDRIQHTLVEDLEEEDPELDAFNLLEPAERLQKIVEHLRSQYNYCFFCKYTYPDDSMDGCPGLTEEDHD